MVGVHAEQTLVSGVWLARDFVADPAALCERLHSHVLWDERMTSRKTASFGVPYNYTGPSAGMIDYPEVMLPTYLWPLCESIKNAFGFEPNSCLVNFYPDGRSSLGFHSDQIEKMEGDTGICIISLGAPRNMRFKRIDGMDVRHDILLEAGSALYMTRQNQLEWKHAIPKAAAVDPRTSLTFRRLIRVG
eukprot:gnl/MRDRNA2_/MRDRNA2_75506_c0_seq3.p1 gnl/MRDRNA2_/MRDRNA2_75506_c0~~gnl/MRDRNA2_/MRDRNA2_75506_c0_seq3.p1  ORF type:complete len:189 (+),score=15.47 gnl/MRDRNA2_/MRDRNA2_75506_c0_seq3:53-619(+)